MNEKLEEIARKAKALVLTSSIHTWGFYRVIEERMWPYYIRTSNDTFKSGLKAMWNLLTKVPIKEIYKGFRDGPEKCNESYKELFGNHYVRAYAGEGLSKK